MTQNIHSYNWRWVPFEDDWQMGHVKQWCGITGWICAPRLSFPSRSRSCCLTMHLSPTLLMTWNHGSPKWKCLISFTINFSSLPVAWGASLRHPSISILSLHDFRASRCSYSLCAVWICQGKQGHSNVFSRWISRYILPIPCDKLYSRSHCTHQSHSSGLLDTSCSATPLC